MFQRWWFWLLGGFGIYLGLAMQASWLEAPPARAADDLRWGADPVGGGPYIYLDEKGCFSGFEVELAEYLARALNLHSQLVAGEWDKLLARLSRRDIDVALNGFEWSPERERHWASSIPYYIYRLQLLARHDGPIHTWQDLHQLGRKAHVGVLSNSAAHHYLEREFGETIDIVAYTEGVTSAMRQVEQGHLDATVQDFPTAVFYQKDFPSLRPVDQPVAPGYYVIFVRRDDTARLQRLNQALRQVIRDGTLRRIYEHYGIWTADQEQLNAIADHWPPQTTATDSSAMTPLIHYTWLLLRAAWTTVLLACLSMPLAMLLGLLVAIGRLYGPRWLGWLLAGYVELLRGTPLLLQLYVLYFLLPEVGVDLPAFWAGVLGLAINYSAYEAEIYRAGLQAIPRGQMEAGLALGMTTWTTLRQIVVPQAVRIVIPPVTNDFIALFKDTSVCSVIAVTELTSKFNQIYNSHPQLVLQVGAMTALLYLLMSYPLAMLTRRLETRFSRRTV